MNVPAGAHTDVKLGPLRCPWCSRPLIILVVWARENARQVDLMCDTAWCRVSTVNLVVWDTPTAEDSDASS